HWASGNRFDTIRLDMSLTKAGSGYPSMTMQQMSPDEVATQFGLTPPNPADKAVVVTLDRHFTSISVSPHSTNLPALNNQPMPAIRTSGVERGTEGWVHMVGGGVGNGCQRGGVREWAADPPPRAESHIIIDVQPVS